ncbi:MAG: flagellar motor switch protein FliN/FliY [Pirellulaceae bacterium]|jgi:flagellar motor switch protein FliN/FliY
MGNLSPELATQIVERCESGTEKIAAALERAFGSEFHVLFDDELTVSLTANDSPLWGQGLVMLIGYGDAYILLAIPEQSGLLPDWYAAPKPSQKLKLETLVAELAAALLPEDVLTTSAAHQCVPDLQGTLAAGGVNDSSSKAYLVLSSDDKQATLGVVLEVPRADAVFRLSANDIEQANGSWALPPYESLEEGLALLPPYVRSLLKIKLPVRVTLAQQKQPLHRIAEINYGSLIQFEKSCDEMLTLEVANHKIAEGEAVKVGDRFGLRITSIALPKERFSKLKRTGE